MVAGRVGLGRSVGTSSLALAIAEDPAPSCGVGPKTGEFQSVSTLAQLAGVFVAGGVGACLRVLLSGRVEQALVERLPLSAGWAGVLVVNLLGCLAIGFAAAAISATHWRHIVLGGLLGGFTTYSAFALFTVDLLGQQRWGILATQILGHLVGGVACVWLGFALARALGLGVQT
jgi:CrcB protein